MSNDIVRHIQCLNFLLVAMEELQAHLIAAVLARGVGYPRDIGVGEQIGVHLVLLHSTQHPVGCRTIDIVEPHAGNDELGIEENHFVVCKADMYTILVATLVRHGDRTSFFHLLYLRAGDVADIFVGVGAMQGGYVFASIFGNIRCSITLGKILPKTALARTLRSYDTYFEQINFVLETPCKLTSLRCV